MLTEGLEEPPRIIGEDEEEEVIPIARKWSIWRQIDPVHLVEGKLREGVGEFAAEYNHQVFVFENEENMNKFIANPKYYLNKAPEMPKCFRLLIAGPSGSFRDEIAGMIEEKYGWKLSNWIDIVGDRIKELHVEYEDEHLPNNPLAEDRKVGMSEEEWTAFTSGKAI